MEIKIIIYLTDIRYLKLLPDQLKRIYQVCQNPKIKVENLIDPENHAQADYIRNEILKIIARAKHQYLIPDYSQTIDN
jgi:hypothetical protein